MSWSSTADALTAFLSRAHCLPSSSRCRPAEERRLARWIRHQRELARSGQLADDHAAWLDGHVPGWRHPLDASWRTHAVGVATYLVEHGRLPASTADDEHARRLGNWLQAQRRRFRAGLLERARAEWLDLNLPDWHDPTAERWYTAAERAVHLAHDLGRLPTRTSGDEEERRLAAWLQAQRTSARRGQMPRRRREWLDEALPDWERPREAAWFETAGTVARFRDRTGRLPAARTTADVDERRLAHWLAKQRVLRDGGDLAPERAAWLDERLPDWDDRGEAAWSERLTSTVDFTLHHGRLPARSATAALRERELAVWVSNQRTAERRGRLTPERRRRLDLELPGWHSGRASGWRATAEAVARFHGDHGRLPGTVEHDVEHRRLGAWLGRQRTAANEGRLSAERERWLRLHLPGWRTHHLSAWIATAERVARFNGEHRRMPTRSASATPLERELGVWLNNQRTAARAERLDHDRRRWLDEQLPGWDDPRLATWIARGIAVGQVRGRTGRLPSPRAADPHTRSLGGWLETQRAAHRSGGLDARRLAWLDTHLAGWEFDVPAERAATRSHLRRSVEAGDVAARRRARAQQGTLDEWIAGLTAVGRDGLNEDQLAWLDTNLPGWDARATVAAVTPRPARGRGGRPRAAG